MSEHPERGWAPDPEWKPCHQRGAVVYLRVEVVGFGDTGEVYVKPIKADRSAYERPGEFMVLEEWMVPGSVIVDALKRGVQRRSRVDF